MCFRCDIYCGAFTKKKCHWKRSREIIYKGLTREMVSVFAAGVSLLNGYANFDRGFVHRLTSYKTPLAE